MDYSTAINTAADFIAGRESFSPVPYYDVNGYAIGYGNHYWEDGSPVTSDDDPITQDRAQQLLNFYADQNAKAILSQVTVPLTENQLAALTSLRYNCGTITTTMLNLINSGAEPAKVAMQFQNTCVNSGGAFNQSLYERRAMEANLYLAAGSALPGAVVALFLLIGAWLLFAHK